MQALNIENANEREEANANLKQVLTSQQRSNQVNTSTYQKLQNNIFFVYAIGSAISFAIHNYAVAYSMIIWETSSLIVIPEGFTWVAVYITFHAYLGFKNKRATGKFWQKEQSALFNVNTRQFNYGNLALVLARSIISFSTIFSFSLIAYFSKEAGVSPSVILSINSLTSFCTAVTFYFMYNEKLKLNHLIGMALIIVSVVIIAFSKSLSSPDHLEVQSFAIIMIPIAISLSICVQITMSAVILRTANKRGYNPLQFTLDVTALAGVYLIITFIWVQPEYIDFTIPQIIYFQFAALAITLGYIFQNLALKHGKGGLVIAIIQTQNSIQLMFEITIQKRIPSAFELTALAFTIIGSTTIALAKK